MIKCRHCEKEVARKAKRCPNCGGTPVANPAQPFVIVGMVFILGAIIWDYIF
ncbi:MULTISPECIES: hypothetical protein [Aliarcobacter]|uniref:hypothetical protein n=1 Tax=Aliarcobacter TaxID=2321111 RepID=UPI001485B726|nr:MULTISPECIES: hypothetical protein [Aliarcobacter]MDY0180594.1 hypothetical protein [Aliarcobacter skirrowii]